MIISAILRFLAKIFLFTGRIGNKNIFEKPLNEKEEKECFEKLKQGDKMAEEKIVKHNLRLVAHIVKKYVNTKYDQDELISVGSIGLLKAVKSYDISKGHNFSTYASRCIQNEILMLLRSQKNSGNEISLEDKIRTDKDGNEVSLIDILEDSSENVSENVENKIMSTKLTELIKNTLNQREQIIIFKRYGLNGHQQKTQNEIAEELNISRSYISRIEKKALIELKNNVQKYL